VIVLIVVVEVVVVVVAVVVVHGVCVLEGMPVASLAGFAVPIEVGGERLAYMATAPDSEV